MAIFNTQGTKLQVSISAVYTDVLKVEGIDGPTGTKRQSETTGLEDAAATYIGGLPDFGSISWTMSWDPANAAHQHLYTSYKTANSTDSFKIICSDSGNAEIAFAGFVESWQWSFGKDQTAKAQVSVKLSGEPTVTP